MGLLTAVKGWLNIGGVKVHVSLSENTVAKNGNQIPGTLELTTKSDKHVLKLTYKLLQLRTSGRGDDRKTEETVLGQTQMNEPFDMQAGETKHVDFVLTYSIPETLKDKGGVLGAVGKLGAFAASEKFEYFVVAECDVKGTALDPSDRVKVTII